jgi:hypothetical protein
MEKNYTLVVQASQVTDEIMEIAYGITEGWYQTGRIDWHDFLGHIDGSELSDGSILDLGDSMLSPAIKKIKSYVRDYRRQL